jgi:hypothetical protein
MDIFPYFVTDTNKGYIFSALNCPCTLEDIEAQIKAGNISESYKEALIENFYNAGQIPKAAYFTAV